MKTITSQLCIAAIVLIGSSAGCHAEPDGGQSGWPRCEPRNASAPGRLNIDVPAENHGAIPPCESALSFYIARNSPLRSVSARAVLVTPGGGVIHNEEFKAVLSGPESGLFHARIPLDAVESHNCRQLELKLEDFECAGGDGRRIGCPAIRIRQSPVLAGLSAGGGDLDVCMEQ